MNLPISDKVRTRSLYMIKTGEANKCIFPMGRAILGVGTCLRCFAGTHETTTTLSGLLLQGASTFLHGTRGDSVIHLLSRVLWSEVSGGEPCYLWLANGE